MLQLGVVTLALGNFATGVQNRGVVTSAKMRTDFGQTFWVNSLVKYMAI